jgi:cytochrome c oxidase cbb3-type subunit 4
MSYDAFRHFADSWGLLGLLLVFVAAILWAFRPGSGAIHDELSRLPLRDED